MLLGTRRTRGRTRRGSLERCDKFTMRPGAMLAPPFAGYRACCHHSRDAEGTAT